MASTKSNTLPMRVTKTARGTHVIHVRGFSKLQKQHYGGGFVDSPTFAVAGLDWAVRYCPGSDDDEGDDEVAAFVYLVTKGAVAWAYVGLQLLHQATGLWHAAVWDDDPTLFDTAREGVGRRLPARSKLRGSGYLRGDCLKIECVLDVCHGDLAFVDPPTPKLAPLHVDAAGLLGSRKGADVAIHAGAAASLAAHTSVLDAYAPRFLKKNSFGRRRRPKKKDPAAGRIMARVTILDGTPPPAVKALLHYIYTDTLPVVAGLGGDGYRAMLRHLLLAGKRYGLRRLAAICERLLCGHINVETAAATLAMADQHGFDKLREACFDFVSDPENYSLVRKSEEYGKIFAADSLVGVDVWNKYRERRGLTCEEKDMAYLYLYPC